MIKDYKIEKRLGQGVYGIVYKVKKEKEKDNNYYVLKQISLEGLSEAEKDEVKIEAKLLSKINSKYVVKYYESFEYDKKMNIIMEYCENGDLSEYIEKERNTKNKLDEDEIYKIFIKILIGLADIHKVKILHRDLKSLNIFLKKDMDIRIGDFGISKLLDKTFYAKTFIGTPYYLSPEICKDIPYNFKSDVWALGCILYELCTFDYPFKGKNTASLILNIINGTPKEIKNYSPALKNLVKNLLIKDYKKRPYCIDILKKIDIKNKALKLGLFKDIQNSFKDIYPNEKKNLNPPLKPKESADIIITIKPINKSKNEDKNNNKKENKQKLAYSTNINYNKKKGNNISNNNSANNNYPKKEFKANITSSQWNNYNDKKEITNIKNKKELKGDNCVTERTNSQKGPFHITSTSDKKNNKSLINTNNIIAIQKIELLPCKERFKKNINNNKNKTIEEDLEKENKQNNENIIKIELLPCKDNYRKNNNNINTINTNNTNLEDTLNQKFKNDENKEINLEKEFFDDEDNNYNNQKDNENLLNDENKKDRFIKDFKIEENLKEDDLDIDLDDAINEFNSNNDEFIKNEENEMEDIKEKIDNLKKEISKLIGEEKLKEVIKIYSNAINDDSKKQLVSEQLEIYIENNFSKNKDKNKIYDIFALFILECEYYDKINK